jgi:folate-binding protein YgfZ
MVNLLTLMKIPASISVFPYSPGCLLRVAGPDSRTFLQGQFTNDLNQLAPGKGVYGLWLDRKGKVVADGSVIQDKTAPEFWVASTASPARLLEEHLGGHIIADDVSLSDETGAWRAVSLIGAGAGAWLAGEPRPGLFFQGRRSSLENWEWFFPSADSAPVSEMVAGARLLEWVELERLRINSGIPSVPADIGPADLPNEGGLDRDAISYSKGCYLGQEVMARIKALGRVRRTLVRVRGAGAVPPLPAALWHGEGRVGEIRSAVPDGEGFAGLALVLVAAAAAGEALTLSPGGAARVSFVRTL